MVGPKKPQGSFRCRRGGRRLRNRELVLVEWEGFTSPGMQIASRTRKGQKPGFFLQPPESGTGVVTP